MDMEEALRQLNDLKIKIKNNEISDGYESYEMYCQLGDIAESQPTLAKQVFAIFNTAVQSDKNDSDSLFCVYKRLSDIVKKHPELAKQVFAIFNTAVQSDKNDSNSLSYAYSHLLDIVKEHPELAEQALAIFNTAVQSKQDGDSLKIAYDCLSDIVKIRPELAEQALAIFNIAVQSDKNNINSLIDAYNYLSEIVKAQPALSEQALAIFNTAVQSDKNNYYSLKNAYDYLSDIVKVRPELAEQALATFNTALQSDKNDGDSLKYVYNDLSDIVKIRPALAEQVLATVKTALQSDKNNSDLLKRAYVCLSDIAKAQPALAEQVLEITINSGHDRTNKINVYKTCMRHLPLEETISKYPEKEQDLRVAHKGRFSTDEEFKYALDHFDKETLANSMIFRAQQRVMNVLVSTSYLQAEIMQAIEPLTLQIDELKQKIEQKDKYSKDEIRLMESKKKTLECERRAWFNGGKGYNQIGEQLKQWKEETDAFRRADAPENVKDHMFCNRGWLIPASFKGAAVFKEYFPSYIKLIQNYNLKCIEGNYPEDKLSIHDAVYWLPEPMSPEANARFSQFIQRNILYQNAKHQTVHRPLKELSIIAKNWKALQNQEYNSAISKLKYNDVLSICMSVKYEDQRNDTFAIEAAKHGTSESQYHNYEDIYLAGLKVPEPFDSKKEFKEGKYTGRFLPREDPRTGFFGDYTDCCQHFGGVGHSCAVSTVKDPFSQLFVVENDKGEIVAGSWTWENTEGKYREVCFDNIEALGELKNRPEINKIYEQVGRYLTQEQNCHKVTIGLGFQDADVTGYKQTDTISLPKLYGEGYSDARLQVLLAENPNALPLDKTQETQRYIRDVCFLDIDAMDKISYAVFPDSDKQLQAPENMSGFVIEDREKGVVGYCLYNKEEKSIYDMAVLPEYRKDKNASSRKLFAEMIRVIHKDGGEWSAEMRDETTLKYLKIMAERGLVQYKENGVDHTMSDGSKVVSVTFRATSPEEQEQNKSLNNIHKIPLNHSR